jgi:hypothetical protein
MSYSPAEDHQRFEGTSVTSAGLHGILSQIIALFIINAMGTSNPTTTIKFAVDEIFSSRLTSAAKMEGQF